MSNLSSSVSLEKDLGRVFKWFSRISKIFNFESLKYFEEFALIFINEPLDNYEL